MTQERFREDAYLKELQTTITSVSPEGIVVDATIFYPLGGGQLGDHGVMVLPGGDDINIIDAKTDRDSGDILHIAAEGSDLPEVGQEVTLRIDWERRYEMMKLHSCMHMLCAIIPEPVTGGSIRDNGTARLDFDLPEPPDKQQINENLNKIIAEDHPLIIRWISDEEMEAQPELVRTMSVKPPMGYGKVRLIEFEGADLQPCGGTHVNSTVEIGKVEIQSIKKKGKLNRRITVRLVE